jgi:hypothetical protein
MSNRAPVQAQKPPATAASAVVGVSQPKCGCSAGLAPVGECSQCRGKRATSPRPSLNQTGLNLARSILNEREIPQSEAAGSAAHSPLSHNFGSLMLHSQSTRGVQTKLKVSQPEDQFEQEADRVAEQITGASPSAVAGVSQKPVELSRAESLDQQQSADGTLTDSPGSAAETSGSAETVSAVPAALLVEDEAGELGEGQMRKTDFLDELESAICAAADAELAAVGRTAQGCPYIEQWIGYYRSRSSDYGERALHRYAPEAAGARTARDYIPAVAGRIRRAVSVWATTGQISGVPDELASVPNLLSAPESLMAGIGAAASDVGSGAARVFTKAKEHGPHHADEPGQILGGLGAGRSLDTAARSRMESAFGYDFSRVRVHTDSQAAVASSRLNARAFTVGSEIAFGAREYQPGTMAGDALLAHELAHVVQQGGASASEGPMPKSETAYNSLEEDADHSAVSAVASLWGNAKGAMAGIARKSIPRLTSGLSLQRCKKETCSEGDLNVSVDLVKLKGSTRTPATDLAEANKHFKKCCVQFTVGQDPTVPDDLSDTWLDKDTDLKVNDSCNNVTDETKTMVEGANSKYNLSSRIKVFYVATFTGQDAYAITCDPGRYGNLTIIQNSALSDTLAHEFGHVLLDNDEHHGIDNPSDTKNLMFAPGRTASDLDASQCKVIYNNV